MNKKLLVYCSDMLYHRCCFFTAGYMANSFSAFTPNYQLDFSQDVSRENLINFNKVKSYLLRTYYQEVSEDALLEGAIRGMAGSC